MFEMLFNLAVATAQVVTLHLAVLTTDDHVNTYPHPGKVAVLKLQQVAPMFSDKRKCRYDGVFVPFERTWSEPDPLQETVTLQPEPGKVAGYAFLVSKKYCPDTGHESVFYWGENRTGDKSGRPLIYFDFYAASLDVDKEKQPKWFGQVKTTVEKAAETDPVAKAFLEQLKTVTATEKAAAPAVAEAPKQ